MVHDVVRIFKKKKIYFQIQPGRLEQKYSSCLVDSHEWVMSIIALPYRLFVLIKYITFSFSRLFWWNAVTHTHIICPNSLLSFFNSQWKLVFVIFSKSTLLNLLYRSLKHFGVNSENLSLGGFHSTIFGELLRKFNIELCSIRLQECFRMLPRTFSKFSKLCHFLTFLRARAWIN